MIAYRPNELVPYKELNECLEEYIDKIIDNKISKIAIVEDDAPPQVVMISIDEYEMLEKITIKEENKQCKH